MIPDYEKAAVMATEILDRFNIGTAPVDPLHILKNTAGVLVFTFEEVSRKINTDRKDILNLYGCENQDAVTTVFIEEEKLHYIVTYNKMLPSAVIDRALARELGHVILHHDGSRPEDVRIEEAKCFAHHLLCPRPLIRSICDAGISLTLDTVESVTGLNSYCLSCIRNQPGVKVPADLNRRVKERFAPYIANLIEYQRYASSVDNSELADFGHYMDNYEE